MSPLPLKHTAMPAAKTTRGREYYSTPSQTYLYELPDEILLELISIVERPTLAILCRTAKRFKRIAQPQLYRDLGSCSDEAYKSASADLNLAGLVKRMCLYSGPPSIQGHLIVLAHAHGLQELRINDARADLRPRSIRDDAWRKLLSDAQFPRAKLETNRFLKLRDLSIRTATIETQDVAAILRLPSLEALQIQGCNQLEPYEDWKFPDGHSNVRKLVINGTFGNKAMSQLICSAKALKHFASEPLDEDGRRLGPAPIHAVDTSFDFLGDAIRKHSKSLEYFSVTSLKLSGDTVGKTMGSLLDFSLLKYFGCPIEVCIDPFDEDITLPMILPTHLETIELSVEFQDKAVASQYAAFLGSLQRIMSIGSKLILRAISWIPQIDQRLLEALETLEKGGIKIVIRGVSAGDLNVSSLRKLENHSVEPSSPPEPVYSSDSESEALLHTDVGT